MKIREIKWTRISHAPKSAKFIGDENFSFYSIFMIYNVTEPVLRDHLRVKSLDHIFTGPLGPSYVTCLTVFVTKYIYTHNLSS